MNTINKKPNRKVPMTGSYIKTYVYLFKAARLSIRNATTEEDEELKFHYCMSSIVFLAFCMEAYLNHIGEEKIQHWEDDFESLRPLAKLHLIMSEYGELDFSRPPFQSFSDIFSVRNQLAHGKTEFAFEKHPNEPLTKWGKLCNLETTKKLMRDTEKMIRFVHDKIANSAEINPFEQGFKFYGFAWE